MIAPEETQPAPRTPQLEACLRWGLTGLGAVRGFYCAPFYLRLYSNMLTFIFFKYHYCPP
jgi:hypothetical protein